MSELIAGRTLEQWQEFARRDDCLDLMVPSDLRQIIAAWNRRATPPEAVNDEKERWQAWAQKRLAIQSKHWLRAAKSALAGDTRELRNRVELAEADPAEVVLSPARIATKGG